MAERRIGLFDWTNDTGLPGFGIERPGLVADDYHNVAWALKTIREYNDQTRRGEFIPSAYPAPPYRGREHGYMTEARRRGGKANRRSNEQKVQTQSAKLKSG